MQADQEGLVGYGEGCPRPYVTGETLDHCERFFNRHSEQVSTDVRDLPSLKAYRKDHEMDIAANPAAWCAIELALLDLIARMQQVPVERLLGLPDLSGSFRYTGVLGVDAPEAFARKLQAHRSLGMHDYKLKWNADNASSRARLEQIQSAVPGVMSSNRCKQSVALSRRCHPRAESASRFRLGSGRAALPTIVARCIEYCAADGCAHYFG